MNSTRLFLSAAVLVSAACSDPAVMPSVSDEAMLAKGGGTTIQRADFSIVDAGLSLQSDGKGMYRDGTCGVVGTWASSGAHLAPAEGRVPKAQQTECAGIAPRAATVTLALRHVSSDPHIDQSVSPGNGTFNVQNVKFGFGSAQATTINASGTVPFCGTAGLRYTPVTYPGTSSVTRDDLGGGLWHMYTRPYPDNIGYCENGGAVAYWHVSFDMQVQIR